MSHPSSREWAPFAKAAEGRGFPYWQLFFESCPIPVLLLRKKTLAIIAVNEAAVEIYGCQREILCSMDFPALAAERKVPEFHEGEMVEVRHRRREGASLFLEATPWSLEIEGEIYWLVYHVDITEKRDFENRLLQVQRLECIGALSSGVAHDLNNILAPIMMSAAMLHEELPSETRREFLSTIENSAQRGVNLLRAVLTFARGVEGTRVTINPGAVVEEVCEMIRQTFPKMITVDLNLESGLWQVVVEAAKFHQVLLNLVINARDAMAGSGRLTLRAKNVDLSLEEAAAIPGGKPGRFVVISVRDTGCGIHEEVIRDIFTPFFTTKEEGQGTGLGLPTVLGIVKGHGGFLSVESKVGEGSTFAAYLPAVEPKTLTAGGPEGEMILVVDDEPGICRMVKAILTRNGYRVMTAGDGMEAMAIYIRNPSAFKVIMADLMMPSMDGVVLARAIRRVDPSALIIATSGFEAEARLQELSAMGVTDFLRKPYQSSELLETLERVIGSSLQNS